MLLNVEMDFIFHRQKDAMMLILLMEMVVLQPVELRLIGNAKILSFKPRYVLLYVRMARI